MPEASPKGITKVVLSDDNGVTYSATGGGGGGAVTMADGANVTQGTTTDAAWVSGAGTVIALLKKIASAGGSAVSVADGSDVAQGTTTDAASANTVIGLLKNLKAALAGTLTVGSHPVTNAGTFAVQADTELPTAAAISDTDANPTAPQVGSLLQGWSGSVWVRLKAGIGDAASATGLLNLVPMMFNGTTYDRLRGSATNGLKVDLSSTAANATAIKVDGSAVTQPVSGTIAVSGTMPVSVAVGQEVDGHSATLGTTTDAAATTTGSVIAQLRRIANLLAGTLTATVSGTVTTTPPANQSVNQAQVAGTTTDTNSGVKSAGTQRVVLATDQPQLTNALKVDGSAVTQPVSGTVGVSGTVATKEVRSATPTQTSVAGSATSVSLLASNASRLGATVFNDSTAILYLKLGATASTTSHSVQMAASSYYEVPFGYTGAIDGIWASAAGNARITEIV